MRNIIFLSFLLSSHILFSQESNKNLPSEKKKFDYFLKANVVYSIYAEDAFEIGVAQLIPALMVQTPKKHLHQLELLSLGGNVQDTRAPISQEGFSFALRYEYTLPVYLPEEGPWSVYLGGGAMQVYNSWSYDPPINADAPTSYSSHMLRLSLVSSIRYQINERIFTDISLPLDFFDLQAFTNVKRLNASLTDFEIESGRTADFYVDPEIGIRFGLGIQF